jgi:fermentation-respiration switch protein FrsA (DUF1100 family)
MGRQLILFVYFVACASAGISCAQDKTLSTSCIQLLSTAQYDSAYRLFDPMFQSKVTVLQLKEMWESIRNSNGALLTCQPNCEQASASNLIEYTTCTFEKQTVDFKLVINAQHQIIGFFIVPVYNCNPQAVYQMPAYAKPALYNERNISIPSDTLLLHATLTMPVKPTGSICIFIHGSGPNDRDESIGPNKPFKDLAVGLASQGIASIRYDKRTFTYHGLFTDITIEQEVLEDVLAVIDYIRSNPDLKDQRIYLAGHSLGGMLLPLIASRSPAVKGILFLAGNARPLEDLILAQSIYLYGLDGSISTAEQQEIDALEIHVQYLKDSLSATSPADKLLLQVPANYWISMQQYHPLETVQSVHLPMLFIQGERDYQVTMTELDLWKKALTGHSKIKYKSYPKLNHLLIEGKGIPAPQEYNEPGHVPHYVIRDIVHWIQKSN